MKRKKFPSPTKRKSSVTSTKKGTWKKRERPKTQKRKKGNLAQAFAATKPSRGKVFDHPDDFIPMRFFRNGKARPLGSQCTCKVAPNKYCWMHECWAARPDISDVQMDDYPRNPDPSVETEEYEEEFGVDLWADAPNLQ